MKRLLLISALCLSAIGVVAQQNDTTTIYNPNMDTDTVPVYNPSLDADTTTYCPKILDDGNVWTYCTQGLYAEKLADMYFTKYFINGEREINGKIYKEVWSQVFRVLKDSGKWTETEDIYDSKPIVDTVMVEYEPSYYFPLREENGLVYAPASEIENYFIKLYKSDPDLEYNLELKSRICNLCGWQPTDNEEYIVKVATKDFFMRFIPAFGTSEDWVTFLNLSFNNGELTYKSPQYVSDPFYPEIASPAYRPLVERGKVWRTAYGPDVENAHNFYEYRFLGNVTVDGKECYLLGRSELAFNEGGVFYPIDTICVGALYEEGQKVYVAYATVEEQRNGYFNSNYVLDSPVLLYDFASPVGTEIKLLQNGPEFSYIIADKSEGLSSFYQDMYNMTFNGNCTFVGIKLNENIIEDVPSTVWLEGVGSRFSPLDNIYDLFPYGYMAERLLTCSVGDEILYMKGDLNSIWPDNDVKKQWLDFTHTVKPRPKAPRRSESVEAGEEEESLTGEYSARELFVNLKTLDGAYTVTMRNSQSEEVYRKEVQTSNIVALNTDLTKYAKGTYTLVIENDAESYTATLTIGDEDGITSPMANAKESMFNVQWSMFNGIYDLTGRRLTSRPAKGLYIENQKLKVR